MEQQKHSRKIVNSSKRSTYDPRKKRDANIVKSFAIKKRYKKFKEKVGDIKTYDIEGLMADKSNGKAETVCKDTSKVKSQDQRNEGTQGTTRTKQRKEMFKKTRSGQPVMKYRIQKILEEIKK